MSAKWIRVAATIAALGATLVVGCAPRQTAVRQRPDRPAWVDGSQEPVEEVPRDEPSVPAALTSPTSWSVSEMPPRGVPRNLTQRLEQPPAPRRTPVRTSTAFPGPSGPAATPAAAPASAPAESTPPAESAPDTRSTLERLYKGSFERDADRTLKQFGYDYFASAPPVDEVGPVPEDYLIGPGDEILVTAWGSFNAFHRLTVDRDGQISLPEVGSLAIAGRTYGELADVIRRAYEQTRKQFELNVALGRLRKIKVHVVGSVTRPGLTELPARATVLTSLIAAGGPTKTGSLRRIELHRGETIESIDLYDFLINGRPVAEEVLRGGDVIFVPPVGPTIGVAGYVQRPAIYEIPETVSVGRAIELAGGLTPFTFTPQVQLERTVDGRGRAKFDVALDDEGRRERMADGELLLIGAVDDEMQPLVRISGEVVRPGTFQFRPGLRVGDLVRQADGLTIDAYLPQAFVSRQVGQAGSVELVPQRLTVGSSRRVLVIDLELALKGNPEHDIELMPLDHLEIRSRQQATVRPTVKVLGPVKQPGTYELTAGLRVSELVAMAGNVLPEVFYDEAELIRRVYDSERRQLDVRRYRFDLGSALSGTPDADYVLQNGDQVVIRALRSAQVTVEIDGEVRFPGTYVFPAGARITELIAAAGGVLEDADLRSAMFTRDSVRRLQQRRFDHLTETTRRQYESSLERMTQTGQAREGLAAKLALMQTEDLLERMEQYQAKGRVVIPFLRSDFPQSSFNLTLEDGDKLKIPRQHETVAILGHVFNPSTFVAEPGITVAELVERSGGITERGDEHVRGGRGPHGRPARRLACTSSITPSSPSATSSPGPTPWPTRASSRSRGRSCAAGGAPTPRRTRRGSSTSTATARSARTGGRASCRRSKRRGTASSSPSTAATAAPAGDRCCARCSTTRWCWPTRWGCHPSAPSSTGAPSARSSRSTSPPTAR